MDVIDTLAERRAGATGGESHEGKSDRLLHAPTMQRYISDGQSAKGSKRFLLDRCLGYQSPIMGASCLTEVPLLHGLVAHSLFARYADEMDPIPSSPDSKASDARQRRIESERARRRKDAARAREEARKRGTLQVNLMLDAQLIAGVDALKERSHMAHRSEAVARILSAVLGNPELQKELGL